ncbi:MAG: hypothetical protein ACOH2K_16985 [Burkholderiaceae bacterium]
MTGIGISPLSFFQYKKNAEARLERAQVRMTWLARGTPMPRYGNFPLHFLNPTFVRCAVFVLFVSFMDNVFYRLNGPRGRA